MNKDEDFELEENIITVSSKEFLSSTYKCNFLGADNKQ